MYVRNGFMIEIYTGLCIVYVLFWHVPLRISVMALRSRSMEDSYVTAQQKVERRQDNGDKKLLARHHLSHLLHSLKHEWIGGGQHSVVSPAL